MANTGRYIYCPAAGRIHGNKKTFREWLRLKFRRPVTPDLFATCGYRAPYYPSGYKK